MWSDNETNVDFLNFQAIANTVAEIIQQAEGRPLSLGIAGGWGVGKSSMMQITKEALEKSGGEKFLFVDFNAWLYQGHDDAKASLMDVIAQKLVGHAEKKQTGLDAAKAFADRVNWFRVGNIAAQGAAFAFLGIPPLGLAGEAISALKDLAEEGASAEGVEAAVGAAKKIVEKEKKLIKAPADLSPPKEIQALRTHFETTLSEMDVTLVVFVDDLDRCLPPTTIATLEAIRVFLFMNRTAFVVAADDKMIRAAVKVHFGGTKLDEDLVTNYFDKLIQVPIRVPPLGTQEVRAYLMLLFVENSDLEKSKKEEIRTAVCEKLSKSWRGERVDRAFVTSLVPDCPESLAGKIELAEQLAPLMTTSENIAGNPRLIKRFLNTLSIRMIVARTQGIGGVDEAALAKILLFERCAGEEAYGDLVQKINASEDGKLEFLRPLEEDAIAGEGITDLPEKWDGDFVKSWLALPPTLAELDLRSIVYISREHLPLITPADQLSSEAIEAFSALLELRRRPAGGELAEQLGRLQRREIGLIMDRLLSRARREEEWGTPDILFACLFVAGVDSELGDRLALFLSQIPVEHLRPAIVPLLQDKPWASKLLSDWHADEGVPDRVKASISTFKEGER